MKDLQTRHELIEVPIGFYNIDEKVFYVTRPYFKIRIDEHVVSFIRNRKLEQHLVLKTVTTQDLADCISTYHQEKFSENKRDYR